MKNNVAGPIFPHLFNRESSTISTPPGKGMPIYIDKYTNFLEVVQLHMYISQNTTWK